MRLWHYKLINHGLPNSQLIAQYRELNSIFKKEPNHILINYVYDYTKEQLYYYSLLVMKEMFRRHIKIYDISNLEAYFDLEPILSHEKITMDMVDVEDKKLFMSHHNDQYLLVCFLNLYEKKMRGQKDFTDQQYNEMYDYVNTIFDLKSLGIERV